MQPGRSGPLPKSPVRCRFLNTLFADMLDTADRRILDFERSWWHFPEPKDRTISEVLGISATTYYHRLRELLDMEEAHHYDPLTVRRLQRIVNRGI